MVVCLWICQAFNRPNLLVFISWVNVEWLNLVFEAFAAEVGASEDKIILLVQDRAGWHMSDKVCLPTGMVV